MKLVDTGSKASVSSSIVPNAEFAWKQNKTTNTMEVSSSDFDSGVLQYDLSASPNYVPDGTGEIWATGLQFTDTITLSDGLTFKDASAVQSAFTVPGAAVDDVKVSGSTATITWHVDSKYVDANQKPYAEMDAYNVTASLKLNCITIDDDNFTTGKITNTLEVDAKCSSSDQGKVNCSNTTVFVDIAGILSHFIILRFT